MHGIHSLRVPKFSIQKSESSQPPTLSLVIPQLLVLALPVRWLSKFEAGAPKQTRANSVWI
jgi:hypothetical protein